MSLAEGVQLNKSLFCFEADTGATSSGVFAGDDPLKFYFPLLLYHICVVFILSRAIHGTLLGRAGVPLAISQILAGALLGPSFLGRFFPSVGQIFATPEGWVQINTVGGYAFTLHIFTVGVKTDLSMIVKSGKKAVAIAIFGTAAPHLAMYIAGLALNDCLPKAWIDSFLLTNLTSWWSLSAFIVVCCTLHDLNLLSSKLGRLAMSAALIGDFANTFSIAGVTSYLLASSPEEKLQRIGFMSSLSFSIFIALMALVARPTILRLIRDVPEGALLPESRLVAVLLISLTCSFAGELLGLHATYGPFMLGLMLPGGAPLGVTLEERLDRLVVGVLTPLLFAQGGMRMNVYTIADFYTCALLEVFLVVGIVAKFVACILPCLYCHIPVREAVVVGLMMNFKGITESVYASSFMDSKILDDQAYAAFMINVLVIGAATASAVKYMYHPEEKYVAYRRRTVQHKKLGEELRMLACVHSQVDVGPMVALLDAASPTPATPLALYLLHLVPLAGLTSSVLRHFKHGDPNCVPTGSTATESERIVNAFQFFVGQRPQGSSSLLPYVCVAPYATMHNDVCAVALEKRAMLIIVPFHKRLAIDGSIEPTSPNAGAIQAANSNILNYSPCSVAILVDRGSLSGVVSAASAAAVDGGFPHRVAVYFLGGPDDREAMALAAHMAEDAPIGLTVFRFLLPVEWQQRLNPEEDQLDEEATQDFVRRCVDEHRVLYSEHTVGGSDEMVDVIRNTSLSFNLLVVGRRAESLESPLTAGISDWSEHLELGILGDLLTSTDFGCRVSTLVVQQQTRAAAGELCQSPENQEKAQHPPDGPV
ncbi:cation/H(+) antiporter 15-like [Lolium rigidum]|uniref:cation/H(+) antiporter 15-like n=1 Tax=Lolium rigidum TaxID=89674 RepID=UPI001F5CE808|nr:cation/H(+) antiporter 15-like [Lolium rigidum]